MPLRTDHAGSTFEYAFGVTRTASDDWFDPMLHRDTPLFVDPFLMFAEETGPCMGRPLQTWGWRAKFDGTGRSSRLT